MGTASKSTDQSTKLVANSATKYPTNKWKEKNQPQPLDYSGWRRESEDHSALPSPGGARLVYG